MPKQIEVRHREGSKSCTVFLAKLPTQGYQNLSGTGKRGNAITISLETDQAAELAALFNALVEALPDYESIEVYSLPVHEGLLYINWRDRNNDTVYQDNQGQKLDKALLKAGGTVSLALEVWANSYEDEAGQLRAAINFRPGVVRIHHQGNDVKEQISALDALLSGLDDTNTDF